VNAPERLADITVPKRGRPPSWVLMLELNGSPNHCSGLVHFLADGAPRPPSFTSSAKREMIL